MFSQQLLKGAKDSFRRFLDGGKCSHHPNGPDHDKNAIQMCIGTGFVVPDETASWLRSDLTGTRITCIRHNGVIEIPSVVKIVVPVAIRAQDNWQGPKEVSRFRSCD